MRRADHRGIQVDIEERFSRDIVRVVREGAASVGICWDSIDFGGLQTLPYRRDELVLAVHADHPLARRRTLRFEQTLDHDQVGLPPATAVHTMLHRAAARAGRTIHYRVVVSSFYASLRVVAANLGISVIPRQVAAAAAAQGQVRLIELADGWAQQRFALCFRDRAALPPAAARMVDFLGERAAQADAG
jgi:DNA-binding transcriptional LysR family regulator